MNEEPCVRCEENAAPGWLLCVKCAATMPEGLVEQLLTKYEQSEQWLYNAEKFLETCRRDTQMFRDGFRAHHRALRVYERLQQFIVTAIAMRAGWPEVELSPHLTVLRGEAGWRKFLEYTSLDEVDLKGGRKPPPPLLKRAIEVLRQHSPAVEMLPCEGCYDGATDSDCPAHGVNSPLADAVWALKRELGEA